MNRIRKIKKPPELSVHVCVFICVYLCLSVCVWVGGGQSGVICVRYIYIYLNGKVKLKSIFGLHF